MARLLTSCVAVASLVASVLVSTGASAAVGAPAVTPAAASPAPDDRPGQVLARPARGASAVRKLGDDLHRVARLNDMRAAGLKRLLLDDPSAGVLPSGRVYYAEPVPETLSAQPAAPATLPYDQTFELHSKPGSSRTIYLDFDGFDPAGTTWVDGAYIPIGPQPAFTIGDSPPEFDTRERDLVQSVWQRVSEDYAPFDVDVTTEDPGRAALGRSSKSDTTYGTRVVITSTEEAPAYLCRGCGGTATVGTFDAVGSTYHQPAWVFARSLSFSTRAIAEVASHEVGHNLSLRHDGHRSPGWSLEHEYYRGQGIWVPIMGIGTGRPLSQWSNGDYGVADNDQDDLQVIARNGLPLRRDDHGGTIARATPVTSSEEGSSGVIGTRTDRDVFEITEQCAGPVRVSVIPDAPSPNLDVRLRLMRPNGTVLAKANPRSGARSDNVATGLAAAATITVRKGGVYYAEVDGVGAGDPATDGYSDYASLGGYTISSTGCSSSVIGFQWSEHQTYEGATARLRVTRTGNTAIEASVDYQATSADAVPGSDFVLEPGTLTFASGQTEKTIAVPTPRDPMPEDLESVTVTLTSPSARAELGPQQTTKLTIGDNDGHAEVAFVEPDPVVETTGPVEVVLTRTGNKGIPATVGYEVSGGTATDGTDFSLADGTVEFAPGETRRTIRLTLIDDDVMEPDETVTMRLYATSLHTYTSSSAGRLTIIDDESKSAVGFTESAVAVQEDAGTFSLTVVRAGRTDIASSVDLRRTSGWWDSVTVSDTTLHFAPGEVEKTVEVEVADDQEAGMEHTVQLTLSNPSASTTLTTPGLTLTVLESDQQPDSSISTRRRGDYLGQRVHNTDAAGQTASVSASRGTVRTFYVKVYTLGHSGAVDHPATLTGTASPPGSTVRYYVRGVDVTDEMTSSGGVPFNLGGEMARVRVEMRIGARAALGSTKAATVSATWVGDGVFTDVVRGAVRVTR